MSFEKKRRALFNACLYFSEFYSSVVPQASFHSVLPISGRLKAPKRPPSFSSSRRQKPWEADRLVEAEVLVRDSKTAAGVGRLVPLTNRTCMALGPWLERFRSAPPNAFLFPFHRVAITGHERRPLVHDVRLEHPISMSSYRRAVGTARKKASVECKFYDARHTFITRLAENPKVSEETIRQLAGHVNPKILGRYAHIRVEARRAAIATLEPSGFKNGKRETPHKIPHSHHTGRSRSLREMSRKSSKMKE